MTTPTRHLWEYDHPYYCVEGNYLQSGYANRWGSWKEFDDDSRLATLDLDQNFLFRWDWRRNDGEHVLQLFFVSQRRAVNYSHTVAVTEADEPAVRAFLTRCAQNMRDTWEPFLDAPGAL
jgi:hypothetical protein